LSPRGRPSRQSILDALDQAKDGLSEVGGLPKAEEAKSIWEGIWQEETHHSTAIEGNTMVLSQVKALLEEGRAVGNKELAEYLEIQAYSEATQWVYAQAKQIDGWSGEGLLNLTELRHIHTLVVEPVWRHAPPSGHQPGDGPGAFRRQDIKPLASGHTPPSWTEVPALINDWLAFVNAGPQDDHLMVHFANAHARFERIHPFLDGNGRAGRLVLNLLLVRKGYPPAIIYKSQRSEYLKNLRRADKGDPEPLAEMLARAVKNSIDRFVLPGLAGPHRMVPLSALTSSAFSLVSLRRAAQRGRLRAPQRSNGQWYSTKQWIEEYKASRYKSSRRRAKRTLSGSMRQRDLQESKTAPTITAPGSPEQSDLRRWLVGCWRSTGGTNRLVIKEDLGWTWESSYEGQWTGSGEGNIQGGVVTLTGRREGTTESRQSVPSYALVLELRREGEILTGEIRTLKRASIKYVREE